MGPSLDTIKESPSTASMLGMLQGGPSSASVNTVLQGSQSTTSITKEQPQSPNAINNNESKVSSFHETNKNDSEISKNALEKKSKKKAQRRDTQQLLQEDEIVDVTKSSDENLESQMKIKAFENMKLQEEEEIRKVKEKATK